MNLPWLDAHREALAARLDAGSLGHAPLIQGPAGVGKLSLARWLIARMLCLSPNPTGPCGECRACRLLEAGSHPDCFVVDVAEDRQAISVDQVRELIGSMHLTPSIGGRRAGWIVQADAMNRNAANALLKTLEEPSSEAWLILVSDQPARLPATIRSRCQPWPVRPPTPELARDWLRDSLVGAEERKLEAALALSGGAPLAARAMIEDGELDRGLDILRTLVNEADCYSPALLEEWQQDAAATWRWLARWLVVMMNQSRGIAPAGLDLDVTLPQGLSERSLTQLWELALSGRRAATAGSIRQDLSLGQWLLEWDRIMASRSRH